MTRVLIDTSVWIEYFAANPKADEVDILIDEQRLCTNKLILCELLPFLIDRKEDELADLLNAIPEIPLSISWENILDYQTINLRKNLRKIGIPDLIILDNVIQNNIELFSFDAHFEQMRNIFRFKLYSKKR